MSKKFTDLLQNNPSVELKVGLVYDDFEIIDIEHITLGTLPKSRIEIKAIFHDMQTEENIAIYASLDGDNNIGTYYVREVVKLEQPTNRLGSWQPVLTEEEEILFIYNLLRSHSKQQLDSLEPGVWFEDFRFDEPIYISHINGKALPGLQVITMYFTSPTNRTIKAEYINETNSWQVSIRPSKGSLHSALLF